MSLFSYCVNSIMSEGGSTCVSFTIVHVKDLKLKQMMKKKNQSIKRIHNDLSEFFLCLDNKNKTYSK